MLILALESSAKAASAALWEEGKLLGLSLMQAGLTHSETLLPMGEELLRRSGRTMGDVGLVAVARGPGSFTGIRIGVSTVKGLSWACDKPCVGVSTLEGMAWHGQAAGGLICPVMDARRQQVYNALFEFREGRPYRLTEDRPLSLAELCEELRRQDGVPFLVGDGAALTARFLEKEGLPFRMAPENLLWQSAWGVGMAVRDKTPGDSQSLLPVYLRLSQAERERQERMQTEG